MTSWHEVRRRNGERTGVLRRCKNDPCPLPGHSHDIQAPTIEEAYRVLEARQSTTGGRPHSKNLSKSRRSHLKLDTIYGYEDRARIYTPIKAASLVDALTKRGIQRTTYHNKLKNLSVILPTINRRSIADPRVMEDAVRSVNVIGYDAHDGYEVAIVELSKRASRTLGASPGQHIPGVIILSMDGSNKPNAYHWDGHYRPIQDSFNMSGGKSTFNTLGSGIDEKTLIPRYGGRPISRVHFNGAVDAVGSAITEDDWQRLTSISDKINGMVESRPGRDSTSLRATRKRILGFLKSDADDATRFRAYCGDDVDMEDVTDMIMGNVHSMTERQPYHGRSIRRSVLSATSNDMNKRRYIASVMFFAGRCCYCGVPLHKGKNGNQSNDTATGEHLDPINGFPPGETKFGNMALCCYRCNDDKSDQPLDQWLDSTRMLSPEQVRSARESIKSFRDFALYEPMSEERANFIESELRSLAEMRNAGVPHEKIRDRIDKTVIAFQNMSD